MATRRLLVSWLLLCTAAADLLPPSTSGLNINFAHGFACYPLNPPGSPQQTPGHQSYTRRQGDTPAGHFEPLNQVGELPSGRQVDSELTSEKLRYVSGQESPQSGYKYPEPVKPEKYSTLVKESHSGTQPPNHHHTPHQGYSYPEARLPSIQQGYLPPPSSPQGRENGAENSGYSYPDLTTRSPQPLSLPQGRQNFETLRGEAQVRNLTTASEVNQQLKPESAEQKCRQLRAAPLSYQQCLLRASRSIG